MHLCRTIDWSRLVLCAYNKCEDTVPKELDLFVLLLEESISTLVVVAHNAQVVLKGRCNAVGCFPWYKVRKEEKKLVQTKPSSGMMPRVRWH